MRNSQEAWCAHTMIAKNGELLICCDCGRHFKDRKNIEQVQDYEAETGKVMPITPYYCECMYGPNDPDPNCAQCIGFGVVSPSPTAPPPGFVR